MQSLLTLPPQDVQATFVATLVDEWIRGGLHHAVICPGSRSTPLALALAERPELAVHVHHDERSGGFLALGIGRASGRPAAVVTTSGTAAVELHPAVVEAHHAGVPLLVCSADRPPELRDVGAPQTVDQTGLYGSSVRWFADPGVPTAQTASTWRALASHALARTTGRPPGPVQLNLPFREPLVGQAGPLPAPRDQGAWTDVRHASPAGPELVAELADRVSGRRGLILAGEGSGPEANVLGDALGWPVAADPRSGAWRTSPVLVAHLDAILRSTRARAELTPEVVLRLGEPPASRVVNEWVAASGADEIVVATVRWSDPAATAAAMVRADPVDTARQLADLVKPEGCATGWLEPWRAAASAVAATLDQELARALALNEPLVARELAASIPAGGSLVVASSMPIRDLERYGTPRGDVRVHANRGANGIDGTVSTGIGVALASGAPTGLLLGDLAFLHDSNGLLGLAQREVDLVVVVVDNDGGGIFSFLPQATQLPGDRFEQLFGTPHGLDLVALARAYGVDAAAVDSAQPRDVAACIQAGFHAGGVQVLVARTDRAANVQIHQALDTAISSAVDNALADGAAP